MANDFFGLRSNLSEITMALHGYSQTQQLDLHPLSASQVCYVGTWMGRVVKWLHEAWRGIQSYFVEVPSIFLNQTLESIIHIAFEKAIHQVYEGRQRRLLGQIKCIEKAQELVPSQEQRERQLGRYLAHIAKEWGGMSPALLNESTRIFHRVMQEPQVNEPEQTAGRKLFIDFHLATHFFWKLFVKERYSPLRKPLEDALQMPSRLLFDQTLYRSLRKEQHGIDLEGILQCPIPHGALSKIQRPNSMTFQERGELKQWIEKLNERHAAISIRQFESILKGIVETMIIHGQPNYSLSMLLHKLDQWGCTFFQQEDPKQMDWREGLQPGRQIACNGRVFTLGAQLSPFKVINDGYKIFAIEEHPNWVVKIANNRLKALMELEKIKDESEHWGIHPARVVENISNDLEGHPINGLEENGQCLIVERLWNCLADYRWRSDEERLEIEDEKIASVLANHLYCQHQWKASSQNLSSFHLLFDSEGILRSSRLLKKGPDDYHIWEQFCCEAAKNNAAVLAYLMHVSKLGEHPVACYYREAVEYTLQTGNTNFLGQRQPIGYEERIYLERAEALCFQAKAMREACVKHLQAHWRRQGGYNYRQEEQLKNLVYGRLLAAYRKSPTAGVLPLALQEAVIEELANAHAVLQTNRPLPLISQEIQDYYEEQFQRNMQRNRLMMNEGRN